MNDNPPKDEQETDPNSCELHMHFDVGFKVNMPDGDARIKEVFGGEDFKAFLDGPFSHAVWSAIQQFAAAKCAHMLLTCVPTNQRPH